MFSCEFLEYFQNCFLVEQLRGAASETHFIKNKKDKKNFVSSYALSLSLLESFKFSQRPSADDT